MHICICIYVYICISVLLKTFSGRKMVRKLVGARPEKQPLGADFGHKLSFEYLSISILLTITSLCQIILEVLKEKLKCCVYSWNMQILATSCHR